MLRGKFSRAVQDHVFRNRTESVRILTVDIDAFVKGGAETLDHDDAVVVPVGYTLGESDDEAVRLFPHRQGYYPRLLELHADAGVNTAGDPRGLLLEVELPMTSKKMRKKQVSRHGGAKWTEFFRRPLTRGRWRAMHETHGEVAAFVIDDARGTYVSFMAPTLSDDDVRGLWLIHDDSGEVVRLAT